MLALGGLHLAWAAGSPWPLNDRDNLADAVIGGTEVPGPAACVGVAVALGAGAALVAGLPRSRPGLSRLGAAGVSTVMATRGALGIASSTGLITIGTPSERFRSLDLRLYSPLCLALAALSLPAAKP